MKRWMGLLFALLALLAGSGHAMAESVLCVAAEGCAALLNADGDELVPPGVYDDLFCVAEGARFALGTQMEAGMRYALGDAQGNLLTESLYGMLQAAGDVILFRQDGLYGAMDFEGKILIPAEYTQLVRSGPDGYLAIETDPNDNDANEIFRLTSDGEKRSTGVLSAKGLEAFGDGRMPFQNPNTELYGYLDEKGSVAIEAKFESAGSFQNGLARASMDGALGVIGVDGEWRIAPEYDYLEIGGVIVGLVGREQCVVYDENCAELFRIEGVKLEAALVGSCPIVMEGDDMRAYSSDGRVLFETDRHSTVLPGLEDQLILSDGQWGEACVSLVNGDGARLERRDQHLIPLDGDRYAFVRMNAAAYYSELLDEVRYSVNYESLRFGMIDSAGNEILPAEYLEIRALGAKRYLLVTEDGLQAVDGDGDVIWEYAKE